MAHQDERMCPFCRSHSVVSKGYSQTKTPRQRFQCRDCGRTFMHEYVRAEYARKTHGSLLDQMIDDLFDHCGWTVEADGDITDARSKAVWGTDGMGTHIRHIRDRIARQVQRRWAERHKGAGHDH